MKKQFSIFMVSMMISLAGCQQSTEDQKQKQNQQTEEQNKAGMHQNKPQVPPSIQKRKEANGKVNQEEAQNRGW